MKTLALSLALAAGATLALAHNGIEHVMGTLSAKSDTSVTVDTVKHTKVVVLLDKTTTYNFNDTKAMLSDLKIGERVVVNAKEAADEKLHGVSIRWGAKSTAASDHGEAAKH